MACFARFDPAQPAPQPVTGWYDTAMFAYPNLAPSDHLVEVTPAQWQARLANPSSWAVQGGSLVEIKPKDVEIPPAYQAQTALTASDQVLLRCVEHGMAVPPDWQAYRSALRAVVAGTASVLPTAPALPAYPADAS